MHAGLALVLLCHCQWHWSSSSQKRTSNMMNRASVGECHQLQPSVGPDAQGRKDPSDSGTLLMDRTRRAKPGSCRLQYPHACFGNRSMLKMALTMWPGTACAGMIEMLLMVRLGCHTLQVVRGATPATKSLVATRHSTCSCRRFRCSDAINKIMQRLAADPR